MTTRTSRTVSQAPTGPAGDRLPVVARDETVALRDDWKAASEEVPLRLAIDPACALEWGGDRPLSTARSLSPARAAGPDHSFVQAAARFCDR